MRPRWSPCNLISFNFSSYSGSQLSLNNQCFVKPSSSCVLLLSLYSSSLVRIQSQAPTEIINSGFGWRVGSWRLRGASSHLNLRGKPTTEPWPGHVCTCTAGSRRLWHHTEQQNSSTAQRDMVQIKHEKYIHTQNTYSICLYQSRVKTLACLGVYSLHKSHPACQFNCTYTIKQISSI